VTVQNTGATAPASYTISDITSIASAASETTQTGYADANATQVSSTGSLSFVVGSKSYPINLGSGANKLAGLRDAINNLGAGVNATVLTTGTGANPNYLSITSHNTGATTLQLIDDPTGANTNLLTSSNQGSDAIFKLNGVSVDKPGNTVNDVIPGLTFSIVDTTTSGQTVNLSVSTDTSQLQIALQDFVTKYNALNTAVHAQVGPSAGALSGDLIVQQIQGDLRQVTSYQSSGATQSLSDLGIQIDNSGQMSLDTSTLNALFHKPGDAAF
jgi:flagellar hook-associated protein 2